MEQKKRQAIISVRKNNSRGIKCHSQKAIALGLSSISIHAFIGNIKTEACYYNNSIVVVPLQRAYSAFD